MTLPFIKELINTFGLPIALLFVMIYQDFRRRREDEKDRASMKDRITKLEDYQVNKLEKIVVEETVAVQNCSESLDRVSAVTQKNNEFLNNIVIAARSNQCINRAIKEVEQHG